MLGLVLLFLACALRRTFLTGEFVKTKEPPSTERYARWSVNKIIICLLPDFYFRLDTQLEKCGTIF